jgi:hypothetical protein
MSTYVTSFPAPTHMHASDLVEMTKSAAHLRARIETPADEREDKKAYLIGRVLHAKVLGFGSWVVFDGSRNSNAWKAFKEEHKNDNIITPEEHAQTDAMAAAIRANVNAIELLTGCEFEQEFEWENTARKCAGRVDAFARNRIIDIKTTTLAQPERFEWHARKLQYHTKLAWYRDGLVSLGKLDEDASAYLIVVETSKPFAVVVYRLTPRLLDEGRKNYRAWLERLLVCEHTGLWPSYTETIVDLDVAEEAQELDFGDDEAAA